MFFFYYEKRVPYVQKQNKKDISCRYILKTVLNNKDQEKKIERNNEEVMPPRAVTFYSFVTN